MGSSLFAGCLLASRSALAKISSGKICVESSRCEACHTRLCQPAFHHAVCFALLLPATGHSDLAAQFKAFKWHHSSEKTCAAACADRSQGGQVRPLQLIVWRHPVQDSDLRSACALQGKSDPGRRELDPQLLSKAPAAEALPDTQCPAGRRPSGKAGAPASAALHRT